MYALVESGSITKIFTNPQGFVLNGNQYPADIFYKWTKDEKEAIGIYEVETDNSNKKPDEWYINTNESYTCLLYTSPSPRDVEESRMPSSA